MNDLDCEVLPIEKAWLEISIEREMDLRNCGKIVDTFKCETPQVLFFSRRHNFSSFQFILFNDAVQH